MYADPSITLFDDWLLGILASMKCGAWLSKILKFCSFGFVCVSHFAPIRVFHEHTTLAIMPIFASEALLKVRSHGAEAAAAKKMECI